MTPQQHTQPGLGAPDGSGRRPGGIAIGRQLAATCHLVGARRAAAARQGAGIGFGLHSGAARFGAAGPAGAAGLPARRLRPPPMRRRRTLVAKLLDAVGWQPGGQEGVDLRTGQGPRRAIARLAVHIARPGDDQQRRAWSHQVPNSDDRVPDGAASHGDRGDCADVTGGPDRRARALSSSRRRIDIAAELY